MSEQQPSLNDFDFYMPRSGAPGIVMAVAVTAENGLRLAERLPSGIWVNENTLLFHQNGISSMGEAEIGDYVVSDSGSYRQVDKEVFEAQYQLSV